MKKKTQIIFAFAVVSAIAILAAAIASFRRGPDTTDWLTYHDPKFGFSFRHPADLLPTANLGRYAKDPSREYYTIHFYRDAADASTDFFMEIRVLEEEGDVAVSYADRTAIKIAGKEYRFIKAIRDPATPSYWMEYITRIDPKWKFEFYSDYYEEAHAEVIEAIAESIRMP